MTNEIKLVLDEIKEIRKDIKTIKENMPDKDMFLTIEEEKLLRESYVNEKKRSLISDKELRKELGI